MNVALTRAKHFLFVIARCSSIVVNPYWRELVDHARETDAVINVPLAGSRQSTFNFPDLSTLKADTASSDKKESVGCIENKQVVELMGLKLEIPTTK
jgi:ATP-dependent exoDNAse (exonuclease V) beta subunit